MAEGEITCPDRGRKLHGPDLRFRLLIGVIVLVALAAPGARAFSNLPYYHYGDEGHLLLWTRTIAVGDAPDNIFYGPLLYYLYLPAAAIGDGIAWLSGSGERYFSAESFGADPPAPVFYNDFHPAWLLALARAYSMAFFALAIFSVAAALKRIAGRPAAVAGALILASVPFFLEFAAYAQPEMAILGIGCLTFRFTLRKAERGFDAKATVLLGLLVAGLGALKIYALVYGGLGWIAVWRAPPGERRRNALIFAATVLGGTLCLYFPYRTPQEVIRVMSWASEYYMGKPPGSLAAMLVGGGVYTAPHILLFAAGIAALAFRGSRTVLLTLLALGAVNLAYFQTYPFANPRNVVLLGGIGALLSGRAIGLLLSAVPQGSRRPATGTVLVLLSSLLLAVTVPDLAGGLAERDPRLIIADRVDNESNPAVRVHASFETGIHGATLPPARVRRFSERHPEPGAMGGLRNGDLLILRTGEALAAPEVELARSRSKLLLETGTEPIIALYRVGGP